VEATESEREGEELAETLDMATEPGALILVLIVIAVSE